MFVREVRVGESGDASKAPVLLLHGARVAGVASFDLRVPNGSLAADLASESTSDSRTPPSFRAPSGALEDSFYMATGRQLWDASLVEARVLVIASERDFWSRPADRRALEQQLVHAHEVKTVLIPDATHYVHLDRPERGRTRFIQEVLAFLDDG